MKLLRFGPAGQEKPGILDQEGTIRDLSAILSDIDGSTIGEADLNRLRSVDLTTLPAVDGGIRLGPCVGNIGKFICVGLNYSDHAAETGAEVPAEPILFMKATSAVCGPNDDVEIPRGSKATDWEVELGIVIGKGGRYIPKSEALDHVAGFCVINDVSERDFQIRRSGQWVKGKSHDTFGPTGPWLVTLDEVGDYNNLAMWLEVDGHRYQDGSTKTMIFDVPTCISHISEFMSLQAGDVISTGTPPGVGMGQKPPTYLRTGQTIKLGIEKLGEQTQRTVNAA